MEINAIAIESQNIINMHEDTIEKLESLSNYLREALDEEQTTKKALEEIFTIKMSRVKKDHDRALEVANDLKLKNDKLGFVHTKLTESHEQLKASYLKEHSKLPSPLDFANNDACVTNSTSCEALILKENVELRAQLDLLTSNYGKLEESHGKLSSSHEDLLASHDRLKLAHEAIMSKVTSCESHVDIGTTS